MTWQDYVEQTLRDEQDPEVLLKYIALIRGEYDEQLLMELGYPAEPLDPRLICISCGSTDAFVFDERYFETICETCGVVQNGSEYEVDKVGYMDYKNLNIIRKSEYKHIDHLENILYEFQCKRGVIDTNMLQQIQQRIEGPITFLRVRKVLRGLGYRQHYLWIPTILQNLAPDQFKPLLITQMQMNRIKRVFKQYLFSFTELKRQGVIQRNNVLNYHFTIKMICRMVDIPEMEHYLSPPKGIKTIENHMYIWSLICEANAWELK